MRRRAARELAELEQAANEADVLAPDDELDREPAITP